MAGKLRKSSPITQSGNRSVEGSKILLKKGRQEGCSGGATILAVQVVGEGGGYKAHLIREKHQRMKKAAQNVSQLEAPYTTQRDITR